MIDLQPFRGYRFRLLQPENLGQFICPPYDMLTPAMVEELEARNEHNFVRIIQNKPQPNDQSNRDRHTRAGKLLKRWIKEGIVVRDEVPSVYMYRQRFIPQAGIPRLERMGVIARVRLCDFGSGEIFPHEHTHCAPKIDRFEHMEAINGNTEIIFGLVSDDGSVYEAIRSCAEEECVGVALDDDGVEHCLIRIDDRRRIERLVQAVAPQRIVIADGHHRYETAMLFHDRYKIDGSEYVMMSLVSMRDPGLVIRPFHRLVRIQPSCSPQQLQRRLADFFHIEEAGEATPEKVGEVLASARPFDVLFAPSGGRVLLVLSLNATGNHFLETLRNDMSVQWNRLNVSIVNTIIINNIVGLRLDGTALYEAVEYEKEANLALERSADVNAFYGCFFLRPLTVETIRTVVEAGERMPQKSTNFFPKFYSGLVFCLMGKA